MALPDNSRSQRTVPAPYSDKVGKRSEHFLVDYEMGGIALQDPSQGLDYLLWTAFTDGSTVFVQHSGIDPIPLFTGTNITEVSLAFDHNMRPFVAFVDNGVAKYYWYDTQDSTQKITELPEGAHSPRCCFDDRRKVSTNTSDIILAYMIGNDLYFRQQRDRYGVEYPLAENVGKRLLEIGMNAGYRLQFTVERE